MSTTGATVLALMPVLTLLLLGAGSLTLVVVASSARTAAGRTAPARAAAERVELSLNPARRSAVRRLARRGAPPDRASEQVLAVAVALGLQARPRYAVPVLLCAGGLAAGALALRWLPVLAVPPALGAVALVLLVIDAHVAARRSRRLLTPYPRFALPQRRRRSRRAPGGPQQGAPSGAPAAP